MLQSKKCYDAVTDHPVACQRRSCPQWIDHQDGKNCMVITTKKGPLTLHEIGKIYGLTRMRICQIEKTIYEKIRTTLRPQ